MKHSTIIITGVATLAVAALTSLAQAPVADVPAATARPATPKPPVAVVAAAPVAEALDAYSAATAGGNWSFGGRGGSAVGRTLIIPQAAAEAGSLSEAEDDLNVMAHILEKAMSGHGDKNRQAMGITIWRSSLGGGTAPRNLYIEGYGALFFLNVNFPLLAPPARNTDADGKENTSSEWEEARRELRRPAASDFQFHLADGSGPDDGAEDYDADKINDLKQDLIAALKNAAHIRKLKSDETVTVIVSGPSINSPPMAVSRKSGNVGFAYAFRSGKSSGDSRGAKLILRAQKSDIEAFQKDKTTLDDFRKKVTVMLY